MTNKSLSIVIPLFNEESNIGPLISNIHNEVQNLCDSFTLILVDDGSTDETWIEIEYQTSINTYIRGIRLSRNFGKEAAVAAGLDSVTSDAVIVMDGDLQHPPHIINEMFKIWESGKADIVSAVKKRRGNESPAYRQFSKLFYSVMSSLSGFSFDGASDFKLVDNKVLNQWKKLEDRSLFFREMTTWLGFRTQIVEFEVQGRISGSSKWSVVKLFSLALNAVMSVSTLPLQIVTLSGFCFFLVSLGLGARTIYNKIYGSPIDGITLLILINLLVGSLIMISLGVIGGYLGKIYQETRKRPRYIIQNNMNYKPDKQANKKEFSSDLIAKAPIELGS